jgi:DNA helicase-2/ATP-dependent DNA helicase PcrA
VLSTLGRHAESRAFQAWAESITTTYARSPAHEGTHEAATPIELLVGYIREFVALDPVPTGAGFLAYLRETTDPAGTRDGIGGVDLLTFHRAKGLEWESVWIVGLEEGFVPLAHAATPAQLAEERRLLYVALTRARETLHCSWATVRQMRGRAIERRRSPFVDPIEGALRTLAPTAHEPAQRARAGLAASRAALRRGRGA